MSDLNQYSIGIDITNIDNICRFWSREREIAGVLDGNNKTYITSDIHGDMNSLLNFLIKSGFAFFPKGSSIIIEKTLSDGTKMKIPNLTVNVYFKGKLAILGDLFDRGEYSRECFELVKDVIRQCKEIEKSGRPSSEKFSERFTYLLGNHEQNVIVNDFELSSMNSWVGSKEDFDRMRADLIAMMESGDIKFSKDLGNGLYGSHVAFKREDIHHIFDFLRIHSKTDEHFAAIYNEYNWLDEAVRSKINKEEAGELSIFLNELALELLKRLAKDNSKSYLYLPILNVLLFNKTLQNNKEDIIDGFFQTVGHEALLGHYAIVGPCTVYMDCLQSSGFKEYVNNLSYPTFFIYNGIEIKTISMFHSKDNGNYRHMVSQHFAVPYMFRDYITDKLKSGKELSENDIKLINYLNIISSFDDIDVIKKLATYNSLDLNKIFKKNDFPFIMKLIEDGDIELLKIVFKKSDIDLNIRDIMNRNIFDIAFNNKRKDICQLILDSPKFDSTTRGDFDYTILHTLVNFNEEKLVKKLLENHDVKITCQNKHGFTPLRCLLEKMKSGDIVDNKILKILLLDSRTDIEKEVEFLIKYEREELLDILYRNMDEIKSENEFYVEIARPNLLHSFSADSLNECFDGIRHMASATISQYKEEDKSLALERIKDNGIRKYSHVSALAEKARIRADNLIEEKGGIPISI